MLAIHLDLKDLTVEVVLTCIPLRSITVTSYRHNSPIHCCASTP